MSKRRPQFFASYRHDDEPLLVRQVVREIRDCFGQDSVFVDRDDIPPGAPWPRRLKIALEKSDVLLAFIGPKWHNSWHKMVGPRLWHPGDWVRREICFALKARGKIVIPILIDKAEMPLQTALPRNCELHKIAHLQYAHITAANYDQNLDDLVSKLASITKYAEAVETRRRNREFISGRIASDRMFSSQPRG